MWPIRLNFEILRYKQITNLTLIDDWSQESGITSTALTALQKQRAALQNRVRKLTKEKDSLSTKVSELTDKTNESRSKRQAIERSLKKAQELGIDEHDR